MAKRTRDAERVLDTRDASLLDIVDNVLNRGVVLSGDLTIALADVDLVYARLSLLLCAADRVLPGEDRDFFERDRARRAAGLRAGKAALAVRRAGSAERIRRAQAGAATRTRRGGRA